VTRRLILLSLAVVLLMGLPALASHEDVKDEEDVDGRLDIRRVEMEDGPPRDWFITTYKGHRADRIFDKGYFLVYFDVRKDERFDYYLLLRPTFDKIKGNLWRDYKEANDKIVGQSRVRHPSNKTIRASVPFRKMMIPENRLDYRWQARTIFSGKTCRRICIDKAPDVGAVTELFVPEVE
jgi:hypothetical protein